MVPLRRPGPQLASLSWLIVLALLISFGITAQTRRNTFSVAAQGIRQLGGTSCGLAGLGRGRAVGGGVLVELAAGSRLVELPSYLGNDWHQDYWHQDLGTCGSSSQTNTCQWRGWTLRNSSAEGGHATAS